MRKVITGAAASTGDCPEGGRIAQLRYRAIVESASHGLIGNIGEGNFPPHVGRIACVARYSYKIRAAKFHMSPQDLMLTNIYMRYQFELYIQFPELQPRHEPFLEILWSGEYPLNPAPPYRPGEAHLP